MQTRLNKLPKCLGKLDPASLESCLLDIASKLIPGSQRKIDIMSNATGTEIHDSSFNKTTVVLDLDLLSAPGVGRPAGHDVVGGLTPSRLSQSNNRIVVVELGTACAIATVVVVDSDVNVRVRSNCWHNCI